MSALFTEERSFPSCPRPCRLNHPNFTLGQHLVDVVHKLQSEYDIVSHDEVDTHAVNRCFLDLELPDFFWIVVAERKSNVSLWSALANQFDLDYLHLCRLILLQLLLFYVTQKSLLVLLERLIVLILN